MARLNWTNQAAADLKAIAEYIARDSAKYAKIQIKRIRFKARQLSKQPLSGKPVPEANRSDVRELIEGKYRIIYRVKSEDRIDILTVPHSARL